MSEQPQPMPPAQQRVIIAEANAWRAQEQLQRALAELEAARAALAAEQAEQR